MAVRFLHSSDWQLGMARAYLGTDAQARYRDDQIAAIGTMARVATERSCDFVVVAGDVFDSLQPPRSVVARAADALAAFSVPVYLLPGNHDPDSPAGVWSSALFRDKCPEGVAVLRSPDPVAVPGVGAEVVGAPLRTSKPASDPVAPVLARLSEIGPPGGRVRIVVGHGSVDAVAPQAAGPASISLATMEASLGAGVCHYVALGDRHSTTPVGSTGTVWYSGAPVATDFDETEPNRALVVEIDDAGTVSVEPVGVGEWTFERLGCAVDGPGDVEALRARLASYPRKDRTVVRLAVSGTVNLSTAAALEEVLDESRDLVASLSVSERRSDLAVLPDDADLGELDLTGFARSALDDLVAMMAGGGEAAVRARDAVLLLHRLARSAR